MRAAVIVKTDPAADDARGVLDALEAVSAGTLFFEPADDPLDHTVLLRAVWSYEAMNSCFRP